jgi:hypothetical protein
MRVRRLRQAVVAAWDRDAVVAAWTRELGLGAPFHDPGVGRFGLCNSVVPVGDSFLEVVTPLAAGGGAPASGAASGGAPASGAAGGGAPASGAAGGGSAAERYLTRRGGDCGYMAIFQVDDMDAARSHLSRSGVRTVFDVDLDDIRCSHVHPADVGAAIVSFDQAIPAPSWRWAGPAWPDEVRTGIVTGLAGLRLSTADPAATLARWSAVLAVEPTGDSLVLDDGSVVRFGPVGADTRVGLTGIDLWAADGTGEREFDVAGVRFHVVSQAVKDGTP